MKNKKKLNPFVRIFILVSILLLTAFITAIGIFYFVFGITEPEGLSLAAWPDRFTDNFSVWMEDDNGTLKIKDIGIERLDEYDLWLQVIDESGREIFCHNKPEHYKTNYSASELIGLYSSKYENGYTVFANSYEENGKTYNYLIGFPYAIGKHMLYYNGENVSRLSPIFRMGLLSVFCIVILLVIFYGFWLTKHLSKITNGIENVSQRFYTPLAENGMFGKIYSALNKMDKEVRQSDKVQKDTERVRNEWIANITHDLKTPLSPIKGYAELLADNSDTDKETLQEYGSIILKNVNHTEELINDLKLTYQLDSDTIPFNPQSVNLVRYMKELVIDIVNNPAFKDRNIEFESNKQELEIGLDADLFRRAVSNLVINALTHNPPDTKVKITIDTDSEKQALICISDNGKGISGKEQSELFNRYYRGTNTKEKPEGCGLGLAIAKQIITFHGGDITVKSKLDEGTQFTINLPLKSN